MIQEGDGMGPGSELEGSGEKGREKALHFPFCELGRSVCVNLNCSNKSAHHTYCLTLGR